MQKLPIRLLIIFLYIIYITGIAYLMWYGFEWPVFFATALFIILATGKVIPVLLPEVRLQLSIQ